MNSPTERQLRPQSFAVVIAILITIAVVAGLLLSRLGHRTNIPAQPPPSGERDYGPPPQGVALIYVIDPRNYAWLQAYDWQGNPRGTVKLAPPFDAQSRSIRMAPDGSAFLVDQGGKGASAYLDRLGRPIPGPGPAPGTVAAMWADDNQHLCLVGLDKQTNEWSLSTQLPGQSPKRVAVIARDQAVGQSAISVVGCSFLNERAILVRTTVAWPSELWAVSLADARVLYHEAITSNTLASVAASPDARLIAESSALSGPNGGYGAPPATGILSLDLGGRWLKSLTAYWQVLRFSGDASRVLVTTRFDDGQRPSPLAIEDLALDKVVWKYSGAESLYSSIAQPGGKDFALALREPTRFIPSGCGVASGAREGPSPTPCSAVEDALRDIVILHPHGTTTAIPGRYLTVW